MKHDWDDAWIKENYEAFDTVRGLHREYLRTHNDSVTYDTFKYYCRTSLGMTRGKFKMSKEQESFILSRFDTVSIESIRKAFNKEFGTDFKESAFYYHCNRLGLKRWTEHVYTDEQEEFLKENASKMIKRQLAQTFNEKFGASLKPNTLCVHCWQRGYGTLSDGRFSKDKDMTIYMDGDPNNFAEENLRTVDFGTYSRLLHNGWLNSDAEIIETAILYSQLFKAWENNLTDEERRFK